MSSDNLLNRYSEEKNTINEKISSVSGVLMFRENIKKYLQKSRNLRELSKDVLSTIKIYKINKNSSDECIFDKRWCLKILKNIKVTGIDGSQISPLREYGLPFGAIQVAAFTVHHGVGKYRIDYSSAIVHLEEVIELKRYVMEMEMILKQMADGNIIFYDGGFRPSFSAELKRELRDKYEKASKMIVEKSNETKNMVVGYIDRSYAKDIARMLRIDAYDIHLLSEMDSMSYTEPLTTDGKIYYSYIKVSPSFISPLSSLPAKIEFPRWMTKKHREVMEIIFSECLLGSTSAYPYILERAHKYAVITEKEKAAIMSAISSVIKEIPSFKWMSKHEIT